MKRTALRRTGASVAALACLTVGLAACSSEDDSAADNETTTSESSAPAEGESTEAEGAAAQVFGPACSAVPQTGAGSFDGMVQDPVATAASNNPLLGTLVTAVGEAGLVDTLNDADALTVFAPTDDAFGKIPEKDLNAVLADIKKDTAYDATTKKGGPLNGDGTARSIANGLLNQVLGAVGTGTSVKVLSQLGIQTTRDGSLTFDTTAFASAVQRDPDGVASTLSTFAKAVADEAKAQTGLDGVVTTAGKAAGEDAAARQKAIDAFEVRMTALEKTYNARFAALDALLGRLKAQQSTLASALSSLPKSTE